MGEISGRTYGKGRRGRRWQGDEERGIGQGVRELSPEWEMCGGDGASPPVMCLVYAVIC